MVDPSTCGYDEVLAEVVGLVVLDDHIPGDGPHVLYLPEDG